MYKVIRDEDIHMPLRLLKCVRNKNNNISKYNISLMGGMKFAVYVNVKFF